MEQNRVAVRLNDQVSLIALKVGSLQFSLGASVAVHAVVGTFLLAGFAHHQPGPLVEDGDIVVLTLAATPTDATASDKTGLGSIFATEPPSPRATSRLEEAPPTLSVPEPKPEVKPERALTVAPQPVPAIKREPEPAIVPQPTDSSPPPVKTAPVSPAPALAVATLAVTEREAVHGGGSSSQPGLDSHRSRAAPSVEAGPAYRDNPEPNYPLSARRRGQQGLVLLLVRVTAHGKPSRVMIKQSSGYSALDEAAFEAVKTWTFEPARVNSTRVESEIEVPVRFKLTD